MIDLFSVGNDLSKAYDDGFEAGVKSAKPRWIPVTERLPELNTEVLVYAVGKIDGFIGESAIEITNRFIFRLFPSSEGTETWSAPRQYFLTDYEITHWMPLPESPKEEDCGD